MERYTNTAEIPQVMSEKMASEDNTHYLRLLLLEIKGGVYVAKQVFLKELEKTGEKLSTLLLKRQNTLQKRLGTHHIEKLFPTDGEPDINDWDLSLLLKVTQRLFESSESLDISQLEQILLVRNDLAHSVSAELDPMIYRAKLSLLKRALVDLSKDVSQEVESKTEELINECINGQLDTAYIKEYDEKDNVFHAILVKLKVIQSEVSQSAENVIKEVKESESRQLEAIKKILPDQSENERVIKEASKSAFQEIMAEHLSDCSKAESAREKIKIEIQTNGDKVIDLVVRVKVLLAGTTKNQERAVDETFISSWNGENGRNIPDVSEAIAAIKSDMTRGGNAEVLPAEKGCILLQVKYKSIIGLESFFEYLYSDDHQQRSTEICYAILRQTGIACVPFFMVTDDTFQEIFKRYGLEKDTPHNLSVALPIRCLKMQGLLQVLNVLLDGEASEKFDKIASSLSSIIGEQVSVKITADAQEFMIDFPDNSESNPEVVCFTDVTYNLGVLSDELGPQSGQTQDSQAMIAAKEPEINAKPIKADSSFSKKIVKETPIEVVVGSQTAAQFLNPAFGKIEEEKETGDDRL